VKTLLETVLKGDFMDNKYYEVRVYFDKGRKLTEVNARKDQDDFDEIKDGFNEEIVKPHNEAEKLKKSPKYWHNVPHFNHYSPICRNEEGEIILETQKSIKKEGYFEVGSLYQVFIDEDTMPEFWKFYRRTGFKVIMRPIKD